MKKNYLLFLLAFMPLVTFAQQPDIKDVKEIRYYGIDFTEITVVGANELKEKFLYTFAAINQVVINESKKYNLEKAFKKDVLQRDINVIDKVNAGITRESLRMVAGNFSVESFLTEKLAQMIQKYDIPASDKGVGVVFIAKEFSKPKRKATYYVVFFDIESREIIYSREAYGKAKGMGLRNFWANSVAGVLKSWKWR